jgi:hypothetical protein
MVVPWDEVAPPLPLGPGTMLVSIHYTANLVLISSSYPTYIRPTYIYPTYIYPTYINKDGQRLGRVRCEANVQPR